VLGKDTEQCEQLVRKSGTKYSVMKGQGTVGGMRNRWNGGTRSSVRERQGTEEWRVKEQ
jgi:hypothetical protein